jgi:hypothetical protein
MCPGSITNIITMFVFSEPGSIRTQQQIYLGARQARPHQAVSNHIGYGPQGKQHKISYHHDIVSHHNATMSQAHQG